MQTFIVALVQVHRGQQEQQHCPLSMFADTAPASPPSAFLLKPRKEIKKKTTKQTNKQKKPAVLLLLMSCTLALYVLLEELLSFFLCSSLNAKILFRNIFEIKQVPPRANH